MSIESLVANSEREAAGDTAKCRTPSATGSPAANTVSNRTGEYLKAHAEIETEGTKSLTDFDQWWERFLIKLQALGGRTSGLEIDKAIARNWYELGRLSR